MNVEAATVLHIILDDNTWNSTISFDSGIPVTLAGTLQVRRAPGANPQSLMGKTIRVFDWTGVTPVGRFQWKDDLPAEYVWDTAKLYTTGEISIRNK
jgi:chitodextrinase